MAFHVADDKASPTPRGRVQRARRKRPADERAGRAAAQTLRREDKPRRSGERLLTAEKPAAEKHAS